jgi:hypothetical protein
MVLLLFEPCFNSDSFNVQVYFAGTELYESGRSLLIFLHWLSIVCMQDAQTVSVNEMQV